MAAQQDGVVVADGDAVTRQEMARLAGVSVDTIKRDVREHGLTTLDGPNGTVLVLVSTFVRIKGCSAAACPRGSRALRQLICVGWSSRTRASPRSWVS